MANNSKIAKKISSYQNKRQLNTTECVLSLIHKTHLVLLNTYFFARLLKIEHILTGKKLKNIAAEWLAYLVLSKNFLS